MAAGVLQSGQFGIPIIVRVPVIPNHLGENKYGYLNYDYRMKGIEPPTKEKMLLLKKAVEEKGLICKVGG